MMSKRFRFKFKQPITCYGEIITEDVIIAANLKEALRILKKEHCYARIAETEISDIELYTSSPRLVGVYKSFDNTTLNVNED
jgi:hypothetical protein